MICQTGVKPAKNAGRKHFPNRFPPEQETRRLCNGQFTRCDFCRMRQRLTTGPRHDLQLLCTSEKIS